MPIKNNKHNNNRNNRNKSRQALADAIAGVAASLVALWTFYPIEVWKTNLQAANSSNDETFLSKKNKDDNNNNNNDNKNKNIIKSIISFQGCGVKSLHTASSSFCYFFLYSWILSKTTTNKNNNNDKTISPSKRLLLSAIAAMMNTIITLPLDVLSSQHVTKKPQQQKIDADAQDHVNKLNHVWDQLQQDEEKKDDSIIFLQNNENNCHNSSCVTSSPSQQQQQQKTPLLFTSTSNPTCGINNNNNIIPNSFEKFLSLWKGLVPALLLCSNPAINYTVFDVVKSTVLSRRKSTGNSSATTKLSMIDAFLLGLIAKMIATIATYPLIRAKVMLMVTSESSMIGCLCKSYRQDGIRGLYKGCDWQLIHTVLKSALMMMVRERITETTQSMICEK